MESTETAVKAEPKSSAAISVLPLAVGPQMTGRENNNYNRINLSAGSPRFQDIGLWISR